MKGSKCKCRFATTSVRTTCPRCGREMQAFDWSDKGKVLSFVELQVTPQGLASPYNTALVEIVEDGPKVICWTADTLKVDDEVVISESNGKYLCMPLSQTKNHASESN